MSTNTYTEGSNKPLVIYHGNCADGFSAAWCFWNVHKDNYEYYPGVYNDPPPDVTGRDVYLVDFSYKNNVLQRMAYTARKIYVLDHHATAIAALQELEDSGDMLSNICLILDNDKSGATIAWEFVHQDDPEWAKEIRPILLGHIEDRDLWKFKLPLTREIQANVFSYEYTFENWDRLMSMNQAELLTFSVAGAALERKHHKDIAELVKLCQRYMHIGGWYVPVASLPYTLTSDAGYLMAKDFEGGALFAACYWDTADHRIFSLRSTDNGADVSEIAKRYGGGGHKHAAGFRVTRDHELAQS